MQIQPLRVLITVLVVAIVAVTTQGLAAHPAWTEGTAAEGTATAGQVAPEAGTPVALPRAIARKIRGDTLLFYFAPDCSHCRDVGPELSALADALGETASLLLVATSRSTPEQIAEYQETFGLDAPWIIDAEADVSGAFGFRGTPAAVLLTRHERSLVELDRWQPYAPGSDKLVQMRVAESPWPILQAGGYLGNAVCATCHTQEQRAWELSHHSIAWRTLVLSKGSRNPECTDCHVTGAHEPGGWSGIGDRSMVNVGCESCHGPAGPHDGTATPATETCAGCHDSKHSIDFDVERALPHIDHFAANGLSEEAFAARRSELLGGDAPKPMLSFASGTYAGSAACAACHEDTHAWWLDSPHGQAMATLHAEGKADDVGCVRCHATPRKAGPTPTAVADFWLDEGVGCESCHGPGQAHIDAGGTAETIQGLGESCPVCVVEGLCTSCHTQKWDPDWSLETRLEQIQHPAPRPPADTGAAETPE